MARSLNLDDFEYVKDSTSSSSSSDEEYMENVALNNNV
jgi:hypothetical protein